MLRPAARAPVLGSLVVLVSLLLAGCFGPSVQPAGAPPGASVTPSIPQDWVTLALPFGEGHDHSDATQHEGLSTANFALLGWDPLVTDYHGASAGGYFCGGLGNRTDGRHIAVVNSFTTDAVFVVLDVTDPSQPKKVGEYILERAHAYDVDITDDGMHVVIATSPLDTGPDGGSSVGPLEATTLARTVQPKWRDACTGEVRNAGPEQPVPMPSGLVLVGLQDPADPVWEGFLPLPLLGPHSVSTGTSADGRSLVLASVTNLLHQASYFVIAEVVDAPAPVGGALVLQGAWPSAVGGSLMAHPLSNGHVDGSIQVHPLTGQTLAYLANWDGGVVVLDISIPGAPVRIGGWADDEPLLLSPGSGGAIHEATPIEGLWDDHHYVLAGQEIGGHPDGRPSGWVHILDTTDPTQVVEVGRWTLPQEVEWGGFLQFSTHYLSVVGRTMFVSLYHGGVWAVDLGTPEHLEQPATVGVFLPSNTSPSPPTSAGSLSWTPIVLDTLPLPGGELLVFDGTSGSYVVRFDPAMPVPSVAAWAP